MEKVKVGYGKSMYGGWFGMYFYNGKWNWVKGERKKDLIPQLRAALGTGWEWGIRRDNI